MPEDVGEDTPLPGLTLEVVDMDVSKNAEFSIFLEPITPNSEVKLSKKASKINSTISPESSTHFTCLLIHYE